MKKRCFFGPFCGLWGGLLCLSLSCADGSNDGTATRESGGDNQTDSSEPSELFDSSSGTETSDGTDAAAFASSDETGTATLETNSTDTKTAMLSTDDTALDTQSDTVRDSDTVPASVYCPEGSQMHTSSSGKVVCCSAGYPQFCDENDNGYTGSCWGEGVNCDTITYCGDSWHACLDDKLAWCDSTGNMICYPCEADATVYHTTSGRPVCCTTDRPMFCDENDNGYEGGCWTAHIDCSTITLCNGYWGACPNGAFPSCEENIVRCQ